ncbi:DNA-binding protein [Rhodococcus rhodochrous]|uniref:helix-turn-helix domain-containing protein n=1 Tax=Rhodococcus rhodochrous TaxID=1829 RepID=UPI000D04AA66|nr:helix-turn-helix domain-containing protein [Rhodococcus rhodochrous]AYA26714.1 DNA-binding protein [Rhodococcus rhodochrous]
MPRTTNFDALQELLTTEEAAALLRTTPGALAAMRYRGGGPRWRRHGRRVLYARADLAAYLSPSFASTAEYCA